jgi:uncharacterized protein (TIGR00369 family)
MSQHPEPDTDPFQWCSKEEQRLAAFRRMIAVKPPEQLIDRLGVVLSEVTYGRVVGTMPVAGNRQPYGLLHGGASCVLAETLASVAAALHAFPRRFRGAVDINATHHRSARGGLITGVCTPLYEGRLFASYEVVLTDDQGQRICSARVTCALQGRRSQDGTNPGA